MPVRKRAKVDIFLTRRRKEFCQAVSFRSRRPHSPIGRKDGTQHSAPPVVNRGRNTLQARRHKASRPDRKTVHAFPDWRSKKITVIAAEQFVSPIAGEAYGHLAACQL